MAITLLLHEGASLSSTKQRIHDRLMEIRTMKKVCLHNLVYYGGRSVRARALSLQTAVVTQLAASVPAARLSEYDKVFDAGWLVSLGTARASIARRNAPPLDLV